MFDEWIYPKYGIIYFLYDVIRVCNAKRCVSLGARHAKAFPIESCLNQHPILFMQVEDSYCFLLGIYWSHMFFLYPVTRGGVL